MPTADEHAHHVCPLGCASICRASHFLSYACTDLIVFARAQPLTLPTLPFTRPQPRPPSPQVAFKSDYLQLFQAQQITAAELLVAKEALAEAKQDRWGEGRCPWEGCRWGGGQAGARAPSATTVGGCG